MASKPKQTSADEREDETMRDACGWTFLHVFPCQSKPLHGHENFNVLDFKRWVRGDGLHVIQSTCFAYTLSAAEVNESA